MRFESSFINVLNHLNLASPDLNISHLNNPSAGLCGFGCISSVQGLYRATSYGGVRQGQISARIDF